MTTAGARADFSFVIVKKSEVHGHRFVSSIVTDHNFAPWVFAHRCAAAKEKARLEAPPFRLEHGEVSYSYSLRRVGTLNKAFRALLLRTA